MLDSKRVIKIIIRYRLRNYYINILPGFLTVQIWKDFILGWWKALASAWFPGIRHFENLTLWIPLRLGLRDRAWKATNWHSRKLAWLSMTIFSKFWSQDHYPICIHGSGPRCFSCIAEQVTWEVLDMFSRGGQPLACRFVNASVEMAKFVRSASKTVCQKTVGASGRAGRPPAPLQNYQIFASLLQSSLSIFIPSCVWIVRDHSYWPLSCDWHRLELNFMFFWKILPLSLTW